MSRGLIIGSCLAIATILTAEGAPPGLGRIESRSGKFIAFEPPNAIGIVPPLLTKVGDGAWLRTFNAVGQAELNLTPATLVTSCDRIQDALLNELGYRSSAGAAIHQKKADVGLVYLQLHSGKNRAAEIQPVHGWAGAGWNYHVDLPQEIPPARLIEIMVKVLLTDLINQNDGGRSFEIPRWLTDGLTAQLQAGVLSDLTPQSGYRIQKSFDPAAGPRTRLKSRVPLTFEDLSWPDDIEPKRADMFQDSAQLFVQELLRLPEGRASLRQMLAELPRFRNWQFSFLSAFHSRFAGLRDVEKWWAITQIAFSGYDPSRVLSFEDSRHQLETALRVPVQFQLKAGSPSKRLELTLQEIINEWDYTRQRGAIQKVLLQLRGLLIRVAPECSQLAWDYMTALDFYSSQREPVALNSGRKGQAPVNINVAREAAIRKLNQLDQRLFNLAPQTASAEPAAAIPR